MILIELKPAEHQVQVLRKGQKYIIHQPAARRERQRHAHNLRHAEINGEVHRAVALRRLIEIHILHGKVYGRQDHAREELHDRHHPDHTIAGKQPQQRNQSGKERKHPCERLVAVAVHHPAPDRRQEERSHVTDDSGQEVDLGIAHGHGAQHLDVVKGRRDIHRKDPDRDQGNQLHITAVGKHLPHHVREAFLFLPRMRLRHRRPADPEEAGDIPCAEDSREYEHNGIPRQ